MQPCASSFPEFVRHRLARLETNPIDIRILMNRCRAVASIGRDDQDLGGVGLLRIWTPLGIAGRKPALAGLEPDLEKVQRVGGAGIKLAMRDSTPRAHELN